MEPCLFRHGKGYLKRNAKKVINASMEPCLFRHGKLVISKDNGDVERLQWSHVFSDMVSLTFIFSLPNPILGFNGAMSFQTW